MSRARKLVEDDSRGSHGKQVSESDGSLSLRRQVLTVLAFKDVLGHVHRLSLVARAE